MRGKINAGCRIKKATLLSVTASAFDTKFIRPSRKPNAITAKTGMMLFVSISIKLIGPYLQNFLVELKGFGLH